MGSFCLAFFAFLRAGEYTCPSWASFDESVMLAVGDMAMDFHSDPSYLSVRRKCDTRNHIICWAFLWKVVPC